MRMTRGSVFLVVLFVGFLLAAFGRMLPVHDMKHLISESKLVFVGRVNSIKPSGITTKLSYPTWGNTVFEWLRVEVEVIEPVKGTKRGETVSTAMLSIQGDAPPTEELREHPRIRLINQPGMIEPRAGEAFLFCLLPTTETNLFASLTAPYDDNQATFRLGTNRWEQALWQGSAVPAFQERLRIVRSLLDDKGQIDTNAVQLIRTFYAKEIKRKPSAEVIYLEWESHTNKAGWFSDVPKGWKPPSNVRKK